MSLVGRLQQRTTFRDPAEWLLEAFGGNTTATGVRVTSDSALGIPSVYAAVGLIAESVGQMPLKVQRVRDGAKNDDPEHPAYSLLHDLPNPEVTAIEMRAAQQAHLLLRGNAYAEIQRDVSGRPRALWPLLPHLMTVAREGQRLVYLYRLPDGQDVRWTWDSRTTQQPPILHVRGLGYDGLVGYSPLTLHRETFGMAKAAEEFGARWFSNGSRPSGVLHTDQELSDEVRARLKKAFEATSRGLSNAHRIVTLEQGLKWQQIGLSPEDSQMLETMRDVDARVAAIFRVPPHMIGQVERSTSWGSGIEQQNIQFLQYSLMPWLVRWEQALKRDLLSVKGFATHQIKFVVQGLLRGDMQARSSYYQAMLDRGVLTINDVLALEDRNGAGPVGNQRFISHNLVPLTETPVTPAREVM